MLFLKPASCLLLLLEPVSATGQKCHVPADEELVLEKPEQKKPSDSQSLEFSSETSGKLGKCSGL